MKFEKVFKLLKPYLGRLIFTILGLATAVSFLILGFGKTIVILLCCSLGYIIGSLHDRDINLFEKLQYWRNKW